MKTYEDGIEMATSIVLHSLRTGLRPAAFARCRMALAEAIAEMGATERLDVEEGGVQDDSPRQVLLAAYNQGFLRESDMDLNELCEHEQYEYMKAQPQEVSE